MTRRITDPRKLADDLIAASDAFIAAMRAAGRAKGLTRRERMLVAQVADRYASMNHRECGLVEILRTRCVAKLGLSADSPPSPEESDGAATSQPAASSTSRRARRNIESRPA